jgi:tRNA (cmo5U34)-methyltransferase
MLASATERFRDLIEAKVVRLMEWDLRRGLPPYQRASVVLSVLTLMFVPLEYRQQLVQQIYAAIDPGGAFVMVEKVLGASAPLDDVFVRRYYAMKAANGYSDEEIQRKRLSLEGVLVPVRAEWNEQLIRNAGFSTVDCFWRWMNFGGWVAIK